MKKYYSNIFMQFKIVKQTIQSEFKICKTIDFVCEMNISKHKLKII